MNGIIQIPPSESQDLQVDRETQQVKEHSTHANMPEVGEDMLPFGGQS
jgi:hypothetical protein